MLHSIKIAGGLLSLIIALLTLADCWILQTGVCKMIEWEFVIQLVGTWLFWFSSVGAALIVYWVVSRLILLLVKHALTNSRKAELQREYQQQIKRAPWLRQPEYCGGCGSDRWGPVTIEILSLRHIGERLLYPVRALSDSNREIFRHASFPCKECGLNTNHLWVYDNGWQKAKTPDQWSIQW